MSTTLRARSYLPALALAALAGSAWPQVEPIFQRIGMDTALSFSHLSLPGATGTDFSFSGGFAPKCATEESHTVVMVFEWGPSDADPWSISPDMVKTGPGGLMTAADSFSHVSMVPKPTAQVLLTAGLALQLGLRRAH